MHEWSLYGLEGRDIYKQFKDDINESNQKPPNSYHHYHHHYHYIDHRGKADGNRLESTVNITNNRTRACRNVSKIAKWQSVRALKRQQRKLRKWRTLEEKSDAGRMTQPAPFTPPTHFDCYLKEAPKLNGGVRKDN